MARAAASGWPANASITERSGAVVATVSEPVGRNPTSGTTVPTSSQRARARRATSNSSPLRRPLTQTRPKLRTDAPTGAASASRWSTLKPAARSSSACHVPMMPAPTTTAFGVDGVTSRCAPCGRWPYESPRRLPTVGRVRTPRCRRRRRSHRPGRRSGRSRGRCHRPLRCRATTVRFDRGADLCHLAHHVGDEALPAETGEHGHAQDEIDLRQVRLDRLERRVGIQRQPGAQAEAAHLRDELVGVADLDVHRAAVGSRPCEVGEIAPRFGHHQVAIEVERSMATQRGHDRRADRDVGDEVPVHDVDVQPVRGGCHLAHLLGQHAEVGRQHGGGDAHVAESSQRRGRRWRRLPSRIAVPAQLKRAQQRMRRNP